MIVGAETAVSLGCLLRRALLDHGGLPVVGNSFACILVKVCGVITRLVYIKMTLTIARVKSNQDGGKGGIKQANLGP